MTQLRGMTWDHPRGFAPLEAASAQYAAERGVSITWDRRSLQAFADASIEGLAAEYDFIVLDHPHVGLIAETGSLLPLDMPADGAAGSLGGSLESYVWNGTLWAYPVDAACQMAVRRPDLPGAAQPDWETALGAEPSDFSIVTPLLPVDAFDMMMTLVAGRGEEDLPVSGDAFVTDENGLLALAVLKALYKLGPSEAVRWNPIHVLEAMSTTDEFAYSPCLFGYINYARPGFRPHLLDYADLPSFRGMNRRRGILGGAGLGVSSQTAEPDAARAFAAWIASEPVQSTVYVENDGQPAHRATWDALARDPRYAGFLTGGRATIDDAWTRPRDIWFLGFVDEVCEIFPDFFLKDRDEETFLAELNALYRSHRRAAG